MKSWAIPYALLRAADGVATADDGVETIPFGTEERVEITDPPFPDYDDAAGRYRIPANNVTVYPGARLLGSSDPLALSATGTPILHLASNLEFDVLRQLRDAGRRLGWLPVASALLFPNRFLREPDASFETIVPFTRRRPELNYYHWITEFLPRLRGVFAYSAQYGSFPTILLEPDPPSWVTESLRLAGVGPESWVEWEFETIGVDRLVVPRFNRKGFPRPFEPSPSDFRWIRDRLISAVPSASGDGTNRIFVSREDADERRLENRASIIDVATDHGFDVVVPSELSVDEQVTRFRSAEVIMGPHGAGLTNVLFADDTTLIELFPRDYSPIYYYLIAAMFGFEYAFVLGDRADPDFSVPVEAVEDSIRQISG